MASVKVMGILISAEPKDFKLYYMTDSWEASGSSSSDVSGQSLVEGLDNILEYLALGFPANTHCSLLYDVSCPNKESHVKNLLTEINKNKQLELLPVLVSIGHEKSSWVDGIRNQLSNVKEVENTNADKDFFKKFVELQLNSRVNEFKSIKKGAKAPASPKKKENSSSLGKISMMVLGGFIAAVGITAIAIALTVLNAATFGIVLGLGLVTALAGVGLFAAGAAKNNTASKEYMENSNTSVQLSL